MNKITVSLLVLAATVLPAVAVSAKTCPSEVLRIKQELAKPKVKVVETIYNATTEVGLADCVYQDFLSEGYKATKQATQHFRNQIIVDVFKK